MKIRFPLLTLALILALALRPVSAQDVVSQSGPFAYWIVLYSGQAFGVSWTQPTALDDVSVTVDMTAFGSTVQTGRAFLTTDLGPTATMADEVAYTPFSFPSDVEEVTLFTGLDLAAGTYYLSLVGDSPDFGSGWAGSTPPAVVTGFGATLGESFGFRDPGLAFLPASEIYDGGIIPDFTVSVGPPVYPPPPVPESPGWGVVAVAGLFGAGLFWRSPVRKRRGFARA